MLGMPGRNFILMSAHLPHQRIKQEVMESTLEEMRELLRKYPNHKIVIGIDANIKLNGFTDGCLVGPAVPQAPITPKEAERAALLHEFMQEFGLCAQNTWTDWSRDKGDEQLYTRSKWNDKLFHKEGPKSIIC